MSHIKAKKTFKEYYADPVFKACHDAKMKMKVTCRCGSVVTNYNLSHHKHSAKCIKKLAVLDKQIEEERSELEEAIAIAIEIVRKKRGSI